MTVFLSTKKHAYVIYFYTYEEYTYPAGEKIFVKDYKKVIEKTAVIFASDESEAVWKLLNSPMGGYARTMAYDIKEANYLG